MAVVRTTKLQLPPLVPPGITLPVTIVMRVVAVVAVVEAGLVTGDPLEKQLMVSREGRVMPKPAGKVSVNELVNVLETVLGLEMTMVNVDVPPAEVEVVGLNDLLIVGKLGKDGFCT